MKKNQSLQCSKKLIIEKDQTFKLENWMKFLAEANNMPWLASLYARFQNCWDVKLNNRLV